VASGSGEVVSRIDRKRLDFLTLCAKRLNARSVYFLTVGTCNAAHRVTRGGEENRLVRERLRAPGFVSTPSILVMQNPAHRVQTLRTAGSLLDRRAKDVIILPFRV
jgi:hypothetical protein